MVGRWYSLLLIVLIPFLVSPDVCSGWGQPAVPLEAAGPAPVGNGGITDVTEGPSEVRLGPCGSAEDNRQVLRMVRWRKNLSKKDHEKYREILPEFDLDIGKRIAWLCDGAAALAGAATYLRNARSGGRENGQLLVEAEASHRLGFVLLKHKPDDLEGAFHELVKAHRLYTQYRDAAETARLPIPEFLGVNLSQVSTSLGNIASKTARVGVPGDAAFLHPENGTLSLYRIRKNIAKQFYLESVENWPVPEKNPEAYYRAARMLIYFATDTGNLTRAFKYLSGWKAVIDRKGCRLPAGESKAEWKAQIDHELKKIANRLANWESLCMEIRY